MTTNHHTALSSGAALDASDLNSPLSELDAVISANIALLTTKGDLHTYSTVNARLAVGANGYILDADSSKTTGLFWVPGPSHFAIIRDQKATTTNGGNTSAGTWVTRDLNTELSDTRSIVSISANNFTPIAGTYIIEASAPAFDCGLHRLKLYNEGASADVFFGQSMESNTGANATTQATLRGTFTATGSQAYSIQHYAANTQTNGLGEAVSDGAVEVYCVIKLTLISV